MAESSSTGNSGTGNGNGGAGNGNGGKGSSGNGGAAPGSQSSSNGSFSTGKGNGNNSGNFSGGLPGLGGKSWSSYNNGKGSETGAAHGSGVEGPGLQNGNFGSEWGGGGKYYISEVDGKHTVHPDANGKLSLKTDGGDGKGNYTVGSQQYMTVDEVYGKGNQSIVESQGDYEASSNEKSNVETSTFGKQDEISVTPLSVTEDKGLVDNAAIQSVEGLDFQQKDKANQEVMEAKKSRDEAEAEDNADGMRDQIKEAAEKDEETETDAFKVGESEAEKAFKEEDATWQQVLQEQKDNIDGYKQSIENIKAEVERYESFIATHENANRDDLDVAKTELAQDTKALEALQASYDEMEQQYNSWKDDSKSRVEKGEMVEALAAKAKEKADKALEAAQKEREYAVAKLWDDLSKESIQRSIINAVETLKDAKPGSEEYNQAIAELQQINRDHARLFRGDIYAYKNPGKMLEVITNGYDSQTARFQKAYYDAIANSKESEETKAHATKVLKNVEKSTYAVEDFANALAANPNDPAAIEAYVNAVKVYNEGLKNALNDKDISKADFNKTFTEMIARSNDFDVTLPDGTKKGFAEFAAEMAVKSPELAKGLYEAKAKNYEENGHKVLAAIETAKSKMVMTWLGSKFTFADNQVRSQFVQMAKTDMRATYATYNNVLNDETGKYSEADKAEASAAINQANSLMTASAALQASTGFFSGIGDSMSDGVYGVTDPGKLNAYQKALNTASNLAKVVLGLGVTPGANEAYQNMYYLAGAKLKESGLFGKDFDGDGFALCQEYGNNAAVGMIAGAGELATGVALTFNPATSKLGLNLAIDAVQTFLDGLYGVQREANKSIKYSEEILKYFGEAKSIAAETGDKEVINAMSTTMDNAVKKIEDFQIKSDEVGNLDNWLEGSGSNVADNGKFNQALSYDEWLKLIEADPVMQEYAKSLNR